MENNIIDVMDVNAEVISTDPEKLHTVLIVTFETTKKRYYFEVLGNETFKKNDKVIVETIRGTELGIASNNPIQMKEKDLVLPIKPVLKLASEKEIETYNLQRKEADEAFIVCKEKIKKHQLEMKLITCEYTFDKSKLIFYFTANGRIDFRELVKDLAVLFKTRIELRQIGVRDEARILGISGVCGRLLCCINYEYSQYEEALKDFPAVNQMVKTEIGEGKVVSISPLNNFLYVDVKDKGISRFDIKDIKFNRKEANILKNMKTQEEIENKILEKE